MLKKWRGYSMSNSKIAVLIHLFYTDMWDTVTTYLDNLGDYEYDLHINLVDGFYEPHIMDKINEYKEANVIISPNKGVDVGGFLNLYNSLDKEYDLVLKLHTKKSIGLPDKPSDYVKVYGQDLAVEKGTEWYHKLMDGVLRSKEQVKDTVELLTGDTPFGMSGLDNESYVGPNVNLVKELSKMFSIPIEISDGRFKNIRFVGGTIFWVRGDILRKYLTKDKINLLLNSLPDGYHNEPSFNHATERLFGMMVYNEKEKIINL